MARLKSTRITQRQYITDMVATRFDDECWNWPFKSKRPEGYGYFGGAGKAVQLAHRYAFMLRHGHFPMPCGLHRCDNPPCFNPAHIFEGTPKDNVHDMFSKGRQQRTPYFLIHPQKGESHGMAKLSENDVRQIRILYSQGNTTHTKLALRFNVSKSQIAFVVNRRSWKHII